MSLSNALVISLVSYGEQVLGPDFIQVNFESILELSSGSGAACVSAVCGRGEKPRYRLFLLWAVTIGHSSFIGLTLRWGSGAPWLQGRANLTNTPLLVTWE